VRANRVVVLPPVLDQHLRLLQRVEDFSVQELVPELAVEALVAPVLPWTPRLYSSITLNSRSAFPSCLRSATKSYDHTWSTYSGRRRTQDPSFGHSRPLFGCFRGIFNPSRPQNLATRLRLTRYRVWRSSAVIRGYP
jgi:hypothetical protein